MTRRHESRAGSGDGGPISEFWGWWASAGRAAAEAGISGAGFEGLTGEMITRVQAMHPDLSWELAPGISAEHALVVTAAGVPASRRIAERWLQHAPVASTLWEYHPARQASPSSLTAVLEIGGQMLSLTELMFDLHVDNDRDLIDTVVFHPSFATMPSDARNQVGFLVLDWALGEDGVSRWIGGFDTSGRRPSDGVPADGLIETVEALAGRAGQSRWILLQGQREGAVVLASLLVPAKWVDHPLMDLHMAVTLPYAGQTPEGLPSTGSLDQLRRLENELTDRLESRVLLVAHETTRGVRTLHLYADSDDPAVTEQAREAVAGWPGASVNSGLDAGWRAVRHLTE